MSDQKIIAVVGATGAQGGGLARAILAEPNGARAELSTVRLGSQTLATALSSVMS